MSIRRSIADFFFPPHCPFCNIMLEPGGVGFCDECQQHLPWLAGRAGETGVEFVAQCVSPLLYDHRVREAVQAYKFRGAAYHGRAFAGLMNQCAKDYAISFDVLSWVPLSPKRLKERGYDQAQRLAVEIGALRGIKAQSLLRKVRDTNVQSRETEDAARRANVLGAYEVHDPEQVRGKTVLLVDDVATTGSTLAECARVLRTAGATRVYALTLAKARKK